MRDIFMKRNNKFFARFFPALLAVYITGISASVNCVYAQNTDAEPFSQPEASPSQIINSNVYDYNLVSSSVRGGCLPSKYSMVDMGYTSNVVSQGSTKTCWAHAVIASCESSMIMKGIADNNVNFAESHLIWYTKGQDITDTSSPLYNE